tara:strand:- start:26 stop:145 length:120 start_codon:yes stop_codon:yes gene_type:complete
MSGGNMKKKITNKEKMKMVWRYNTTINAKQFRKQMEEEE